MLVVEDVGPLYEDGPAEDFGEGLVAYWDPTTRIPDHGGDHTGSVVQYADGLKIEFSLAVAQRGDSGGPEPAGRLDVAILCWQIKTSCSTYACATHTAYVPSRPDKGPT